MKVNYDAGNVMDYLKSIRFPTSRRAPTKGAAFVSKITATSQRSRLRPRLGEIDHYKLLHPVSMTGLKLPLCCENIFAPVIARPARPEGVDALARRARVFLQTVIAGLAAA